MRLAETVDEGAKITVEVISDIERIDATDWDACAHALGNRPGDPFTTHRFLLALEQSGSVGTGTGWAPQHLIARLGDQVIAVLPAYLKSHSQGEYIFDHNWAHAYENAGGNYYPKLQAAVPFTPVTGRRFLIRPEFEDVGGYALMTAAQQIAMQNELSSVHINFCQDDETGLPIEQGFLKRVGQQFHWYNKEYNDFNEFLGDLASRKRKNIKKERTTAQGFGGTIHQFQGDEIQPEHWDAFWHFYQDTGARKWGTPYLSRGFFDCAQETLRDDILLIMCERDGKWIAGALNFIGQDALYGRYWGCVEHHACLHFEVCYYRAIDYAIEHGLSRVEAGAQGQHKLARGYLPSPIYSLHWFANKGFGNAVAKYLEAEGAAVDDEIEILTQYGPFKKITKEPTEEPDDNITDTTGS